MLYYGERVKLCKFIKKMYDRKFTNAAGGNVSIKVSDDHFIMSPTLMSQNYLCDLNPEQILVIDKEKNIIDGRIPLHQDFVSAPPSLLAYRILRLWPCGYHASSPSD